jgi:hypothetical protein
MNSSMKMGAESKGRRLSRCYVIAALWVAACGGAFGQTTVGGEAHFLRHCGDGCGEGLECIADVCTRSCRIDDAGACKDLASAARCTNSSIEPGVIAVCDQSCGGDAGCRAGFSCEAGYCRGPALSGSPNPPEPVGEAGQSSGGTPMSSGGTTLLPIGGTEAAGMGGSDAGAGGSGPPLPAACSLPFEGGDCDGSIPVFAFVEGACQPRIYGGCGGNENRFYSIEECLSACEQRPAVNACPDGRVEREICVACGLGPGGCDETLIACAQPCDAETECGSRSYSCHRGVCQLGGCI